MTASDPSAQPWLLVLAALLVGPTAALLYEGRLLVIGPSGSLWPIGFVAGAAATGLWIGCRLSGGGSRAAGAVIALVSGAVLAYYGFFLLFFGLGGSR